MSKDATLAAPIARKGMILPNGEVVLPLTDGTTVVYRVFVTIGYRCLCVGRIAGETVIELALDHLAATENCIRVAQAETNNIVDLSIAAE